MLSKKERLLKLKSACSRTIPNAGANSFMRGAHHRRCAREGLTGNMMPYLRAGCKFGVPWTNASARGKSAACKPRHFLSQNRKATLPWF